jgi:hypothetical protein
MLAKPTQKSFLIGKANAGKANSKIVFDWQSQLKNCF